MHKTIGITGCNGFIGSHLVERLKRAPETKVISFERSWFDNSAVVQEQLAQCDIVVHLAGMNRGQDEVIYETNVRLVTQLINSLTSSRLTPKIVFASSTLENSDTAYGRSKKECRLLLEGWAQQHNATAVTLEIPNVFGDRCKPFYNSVVATFCHQLARGETPTILVDKTIEFISINELTEVILETILSDSAKTGTLPISGNYSCTISRLLALLTDIRDKYFKEHTVPDLRDPFFRQLYATFLTYIPSPQLEYGPPLRSDERGSLCELIKIQNSGQIFFSTTKPGKIRGNHYHTRKLERFCVVQGDARIKVRHIDSTEVIDYTIAQKQPSEVEIPIFHTHSIENIGTTDLITVFWCNEIFNPDDSDTFFLEV